MTLSLRPEFARADARHKALYPHRAGQRAEGRRIAVGADRHDEFQEWRERRANAR
jgi:hypothetical protein